MVEVSAKVAGALKSIESDTHVSYHSYGAVPPGFVGPDGLIGFFILPPIDEPPIVEPLPEGEAPDGLLVEPGEVDPKVPVEGLPGAVVEPPAAPGAVPPVLAPPPIASPLPAAPAAPPPPTPPPPPPWAYTAGAKAASARLRLRTRPDLRLRLRMNLFFLQIFRFRIMHNPTNLVRAATSAYKRISHSQLIWPL
jgi:hypothetical protein